MPASDDSREYRGMLFDVRCQAAQVWRASRRGGLRGAAPRRVRLEDDVDLPLQAAGNGTDEQTWGRI